MTVQYIPKITAKSYYNVWNNQTLVDGLNTFDITDGLANVTNWSAGIVAIDKSLFRVEVATFGGSVIMPEVVMINNFQFGFYATNMTKATVSVRYDGDLGIKDVVTPTYNFDLTMDWSILLDNNGSPYPVTDQATFTQWLTNGTMNSEDSNNFTNIVITDFIKVGNNIKCNLTANATIFNLSNNIISNPNTIGNVIGLEVLYLNSNNITKIDLDFQNFPNLQFLVLDANQFTLTGYTATEPWANSLPISLTTKNIWFTNNPASVSGTNLQAILISKGWTVQA